MFRGSRLCVWRSRCLSGAATSWLCDLGRSNLSVVVQSLSCVWLLPTPWTAAHQASLSFTISWSWLKLMSIESMKPTFLSLCKTEVVTGAALEGALVRIQRESRCLARWQSWCSLVPIAILSREL